MPLEGGGGGSGGAASTSSDDSVASYGVKCFANPDAVWERFLPSDYQEILSRSISPVNYSTKEELYFSLCDYPILLDDGNLSFSLHKQNGKKCFMLGAKALSVAWSPSIFWRWRPSPQSRFSEVAELVAVCWLEIKGRLKASMLSSMSTYAAYLVYDIGPLSHGLDFRAKALVRHVDGTKDDVDDDDVSMTDVYLKPSNTQAETIGGVPQRREDGWMEIELGKFFSDGVDGELDIRFTETSELKWKSGLIVEGIDIRPVNG